MLGSLKNLKDPKDPKGSRAFPQIRQDGVFAYVWLHQRLRGLNPKSTGGLDPRDLFLRSDRKQGFLADPFKFQRQGEVFAYVGSNQNLKDLKNNKIQKQTPQSVAC